MAFVNEEITEEMDIELLNSFNFKNPVTNKPLRLWKWTIDRERDAFLVGLGGVGYYDSEIPMFHALVWEKNVIILETYSEEHGKYSSGIEVRWKISKIKAPEILIQDQQTIINLIKDAFDAKGVGYERDCVISVNFDYIAKPSFVKEVHY